MKISKEKAASLLEEILLRNYLCEGSAEGGVIGDCHHCEVEGDKQCEKALALTMAIELLRDEKTDRKGNGDDLWSHDLPGGKPN